LTGAGVVACQFGFAGGESIAVYGVGAVGLSAIMAARKLGARAIVAVDVNADRLALALELGATHVINAAEVLDVVACLKEIFPDGLPFVLDTSGNASAFQSAMRSLATGGRMAYCILPAPMDEFQFKPFDLFKRAAALEAVSFGSAEAISFVPEMISWYERGEFPVDRLVTTFPFSGLNDAVAASIAGEAIKPVLDMRTLLS
jgi:aryl-alcohol dehydrogenase